MMFKLEIGPQAKIQTSKYCTHLLELKPYQIMILFYAINNSFEKWVSPLV